MYTNFKKESKLLLVDESGKGVEVIVCPSGWHDLDAQLIQAISDDLGCGKVQILGTKTIQHNSWQDADFHATLWDNTSGEQYNELAKYSLIQLNQ